MNEFQRKLYNYIDVWGEEIVGLGRARIIDAARSINVGAESPKNE
jgi:hypothetical protein